MDPLLRALAIFFFLWLVFRLSGKRTLKDVTIFDFILLLIISEAVQQSLIDEDFSLINGFIIIAAYVLLDIGFAFLKRVPKLERILDGKPLLLVVNGEILVEQAHKSRIEKDDIMEAAREQHGIKQLQEIKYAVLEKDGMINIIPNK